jgi:drug/metabolite transporter (DMT)-like permease
MLKNFALILFSVVLGVLGQLSLKRGVMTASSGASSGITRSLDIKSIAGFLSSAVHSEYVLLGFLLYFVSAISWLIILTRVNLSIAYPMISVGYIVIVLVSKYVLHEEVSALAIFGTLLICFGVFLILRSMPGG